MHSPLSGTSASQIAFKNAVRRLLGIRFDGMSASSVRSKTSIGLLLSRARGVVVIARRLRERAPASNRATRRLFSWSLERLGYDEAMSTKKPPKPLVGRKLLVAALGVATVNYVASTACGGKEEQSSSASSSSSSSGKPPTSGNLPNPEERDATPPPTSGNLPAPDPDAGLDAGDASDADADADDDGG